MIIMKRGDKPMKKFVSFVMTIILIMTVVFSFTGAQTDNKIGSTMTVSADNVSYALSENLYGLSLDNQDFAVNGGLVAEYVNNNSFECDNPTWCWSVEGVTYFVDTESSMNENNPNYLNVTVDGSGAVKNLGYTEIYNNKSFQFSSNRAKTADMGFCEGETYSFSAFFKNIDYVGTMTLSLEAEGNTEKYQFNIDNCTDWTKVSLEIMSDVTADGALKINFEGTGSFYMDSVSLVPKNSYGNTKYASLRTDLVNAIKGLSPSYVRFYETVTYDENGTCYDWRDTIGSLETRKQTIEQYDDAYCVNSNAMGFYEYLVLCEDLGATPVPVFDVSAVAVYEEKEVETTVTYNEEETTETTTESVTDENGEIVEETEIEELDIRVQKVLDFIEYATGDETTPWGAKRVENGHTEPFKLEYIVLSVEDSITENELILNEIYNIVGEKYSQIDIILDSVSSLDDSELQLKVAQTDCQNALVNEYFGTKRINLYDNIDRYDHYERSGNKVTVDSYISSADGIGTVITGNNIWSAIENSAFLTSLEKNADLVEMSSYKWTLAKRNAQTEKRSLIWFDSQDILLTADYYAQMIFANNYGTNYVTTDYDMTDEGIYHSVTVDTVKKSIYIKLVNTAKTSHKIDITVDGFKNVGNPSVQYMSEQFKSAYNDFDEPLHVAPVQTDLTIENNTVSYEMGGYSISVIRIPYSTNDGSRLYDLPETDIISPYIHPMVEYAFPLALVALIFITGLVVLIERIYHHKTVKESKEEKN